MGYADIRGGNSQYTVDTIKTSSNSGQIKQLDLIRRRPNNRV